MMIKTHILGLERRNENNSLVIKLMPRNHTNEALSSYPSAISLLTGKNDSPVQSQECGSDTRIPNFNREVPINLDSSIE
jgi:hypothetical protein